MSTVIPNDATQLEESSSTSYAPRKTLKSTYDAVLTTLAGNEKIILITGASRAGKTALIHTICKTITAKYRIITLSGKDLPSLFKSKNNNDETQLNNIEDFILESTDIGDELVIILDDADCLPISFLSRLIERTKQSVTNGYHLQLILSGPLNFKDQLLAIEPLNAKDLSHFPIDGLDEKEMHAYVKNKSYKISSNIKRIEFKPEALRTLADFIQSDQQTLDVVLEWCAALVNKDKLASISSHTVNRAASFAQQFSKDKNLRLTNSYPPSHEVYKYINNIQSTKDTKNSSAKIYKKSVDKLNRNKTSVQFKNRSSAQKTKFPSLTSKVSELIEKGTPVPELDKASLNRVHEIEDEIMPTQWTPSSKKEIADKKSFPVIAGLLSILVLCFIAFIAFRINSDPNIEELPNKQVVSSELEETTIENQLGSEEVKSNEATSTNNQTAIAIAEPQQQPVEAIANKTEKPVLVTESDKESLLVARPQEQNQLSENTLSNELAKESQQKPLVVQETTKTEVNTSLTTEIDDLLVLAESQLENKRLSTPSGNNALETYQKILAKQPDNEAAINGIKKVHDKYLSWANYYFKNNEIKRAKYFYNKALGIDPADKVAITSLQNIAQQESIAETNKQNLNSPQDPIQLDSTQNLLVTADLKLKQIKNDISSNNRNYKVYQEAQTIYQTVLRTDPQNQQAIQGLSLLTGYYIDWAELQIVSKNYNIALFLYGQALSLQPNNSQIAQRIEQIQELKKVF